MSAKPPEDPAEPGPTDELAPERAEHAFVRRFRVSVVEGPDTGRSFESAGARAVIGTHESADLVLHDRAVSRFHCEISLSEGRALLRDLGSLNGTRVDDLSVVQAWLPGDKLISVGRSHLHFSLGADHVRVPLSAQDRFGGMLGGSPAMREVFAVLERAAGRDATVLLEGETGTGKELAAEALHQASARREGPFVVVDCGAIPPALLESELFGHEAGSFTGALGMRCGAFEAAHGGTIFLDEIGELAAELQPKLLRALERHEVKRVGGNSYSAVDVRVVAAANRNLRAEVNAGRFRSDLYYRLAVVEVRLPPLRERREDIPALVGHLLDELGGSGRPEAAALASGGELLPALARHDWPGNVRELKNYLERCLTLGRRAPLVSEGTTTAPLALDARQPYRLARAAFERRYLEELLRLHADNVSAAARAAGVDRIQLYRMLWRHGLR